GSAAERMLRATLPEGAELDVRFEGIAPGLIRPDEPAVQLGLEAFERAVGVRPLLVRSGGSLPIVPALAARGTPAILTGGRGPAPGRPVRRLAADRACAGRAGNADDPDRVLASGQQHPLPERAASRRALRARRRGRA